MATTIVYASHVVGPFKVSLKATRRHQPPTWDEPGYTLIEDVEVLSVTPYDLDYDRLAEEADWNSDDS